MLLVFSRLEFGSSFNLNPTTIFGNGDEYVNERSLAGCSRWENGAQGNHKIHQIEFTGLNHITILDNSGPINYIAKTLINDHDHKSDNV